ncbi:MAG TPA: PRC-barrel domain-containing protein [Longimicrobium sp.]|nr:PRC-barrel domain-containing protein [Longimicrobium sp.]
MAANDMDRVVPLSQLDDFKVADGEPDVRGWEVLASDGRKVGEVDELLVDTAAMKVRYLDVDVETAGGGHDRHVLIPIGYARVDDARDCVMLDSVASSELGGIPSYDQGPLTRDFESSLRQTFSARRADTGYLGGGGGMMDTAGLDNTPGVGTGLSMTGAGGVSGGGMNAGASDMDDRGNRLGSTGSSAGVMSSMSDGLGAGERTSAGSQGPVGGLDREEARMRGDASHGTGLAGSDYLHNSDEDFYASDAFDDARFYASRRRGGPALGSAGGMGGSPNDATRGKMGLSAGTGGADQVDPLAGSGLKSSEPTLHGAGQEGVGADREETTRLAREARELLREDHANRDVPGGGTR